MQIGLARHTCIERGCGSQVGDGMLSIVAKFTRVFGEWERGLTLLPTLPWVLGRTSTPLSKAALMVSGVRLGLAATMSAARPPPTAAASEADPVGTATSIHALRATTRPSNVAVPCLSVDTAQGTEGGRRLAQFPAMMVGCTLCQCRACFTIAVANSWWIDPVDQCAAGVLPRVAPYLVGAVDEGERDDVGQPQRARDMTGRLHVSSRSRE
jgi:hypothetical protein